MDLGEVASRLASASVISFDTETQGLDWRRDRICGYAIGFEDRAAAYLPVRHAEGPNLDTQQIEAGLARRLARRDLTVVGHNLAFDLMFCRREGILIGGKIQDTSIYAAMLDEHSPSFSLAAQTQKYECETRKETSIYDYLIEKFSLDAAASKQAMNHFHRLSADDPKASSYAQADAIVNLELYQKMLPQLELEGLGRIKRLEDELLPVLHEMSWRGMPIDEERLHQVIGKAEAALGKAEHKLPPGFNPRSPLQMQEYFENAGVTDWPTTLKGRPSFPEAWVKRSPAGQLVLEAKKWLTLLSTFLYPIRDLHLHKGRVHTDINQLRRDEGGTVTGRLSSRDPNLYNMPSPKRQPEQGKLLRQIFVADPGMEFAEADYSQIEPRLFAQFAEIKSWLKGYNADPPMDCHSMVATMTGLPRPQGKTINMALLYGMGEEALIDALGVDKIKGKIILDTYHQKVPEVRAFTRKAEALWRRKGYVHSVLKRRFRLRDERDAYMATNRIIQGSNADIVKQALINCHRVAATADCELLNSVYDSIAWQGGNHQVMLDAMLDLPDIPFRVPMEVELMTGQRWSDCSGV